MDSQITAVKRRPGCSASARRSARPPSRGSGTAMSSWARPWPRRSSSVRPDSMSQNQAVISQPGGSAAWLLPSCRGSDSVGSCWSSVDTRPRNATRTRASCPLGARLGEPGETPAAATVGGKVGDGSVIGHSLQVRSRGRPGTRDRVPGQEPGGLRPCLMPPGLRARCRACADGVARCATPVPP